MTGIDVSRKDHDKSVIVFHKSKPQQAPFACVSLSDVDTLRLIDFPQYETERLAEAIRSTFAYGLNKETNKDENCLEFELRVSTPKIPML